MPETSSVTQREEAWAPDQETRDLAREYFDAVFVLPNLEPLIQGVKTGPESEADPASTIYDETLLDMVRLLEEFRFGASVGAMYARGVREQIRPLRESHKLWPQSVGMSPKVLALLSAYGQNTLPPDRLIFEPAAALGGHRVLGGWWAAQLLDSAIIRGVSVLDRVSILLHCIAGRIDPRRMPAFRTHQLEDLATNFSADPEWTSLLDLARSEVFLFVKDMRDGHVHRRRVPAELHGAFVTSGTDAEGRHQSTLGADPDIQWALATALFRDVIRPALEAAGAMIARRSAPFDERVEGKAQSRVRSRRR